MHYFFKGTFFDFETVRVLAWCPTAVQTWLESSRLWGRLRMGTQTARNAGGRRRLSGRKHWLSAHRRRATEFPHFSIRAREQASHPATHVPSIIVHMRKMPVITADELDRRALESVTIQTAVMFEDAQ